MIIYELHSGIDGEAIAYFDNETFAEISMQTLMKRYGVEDPEEVELFIFEHRISELPIVD